MGESSLISIWMFPSPAEGSSSKPTSIWGSPFGVMSNTSFDLPINARELKWTPVVLWYMCSVAPLEIVTGLAKYESVAVSGIGTRVPSLTVSDPDGAEARPSVPPPIFSTFPSRMQEMAP